MGARLLVYDATRPPGEFWLRTAWATGARVYQSLGRVDASFGARDWDGALAWLCAYRGEDGDDGAIDEIQYWGHGKWGKVYIANDVLSLASFGRGHVHEPALRELKARLSPRALLWFRTCETFGADAGQAFAEGLTDALACRAAGHSFVIHALQSGLHGLMPGSRAHWDPAEGLSKGTAAAPVTALSSTPGAPNTLHFMNGVVPPAWFG